MFLSEGVAVVQGSWKLSLQYFLLPSCFGDKLHRASYCHNKLLFTLYSFHLPHCPVCDQSHQSLSRECRIRSTDSRVFCKCRLDTLSARLWERGTKASEQTPVPTPLSPHWRVPCTTLPRLSCQCLSSAPVWRMGCLVQGSGRGRIRLKLSLQYFLSPSCLETSSTEQVTAITSSFTLYSFHLPHCPVCDQSHQSLSRECRIRFLS